MQLKVQVWPCGLSGLAHIADDLSHAHHLPLTDRVAAQMGAYGGKAALMGQNQIVSVAVAGSGGVYIAVGEGQNVIPAVRSKIRAVVEAELLINRVQTVAESGGVIA